MTARVPRRWRRRRGATPCTAGAEATPSRGDRPARRPRHRTPVGRRCWSWHRRLSAPHPEPTAHAHHAPPDIEQTRLLPRADMPLEREAGVVMTDARAEKPADPPPG